MKERLTGAIILVAVLVLLVPELLSGPGESFTMQPAGAEDGAPLRSYTIDLAGNSSSRAAVPTSAPTTVVTDEPVAAATPGSDVAGPDESPASVSARSGADAASSASGSAAGAGSPEDRDRVPGSGADRAAATPPNSTRDAAVDGNASAPSAADDRPRSAFGPNAVQRPKPAASEPARAGSSEPSRTAASESKPAKGWAVQLGVFASRENADRLAKQVKGKGYTVSVNETSANGKRLYRVRVGPEPTRAAAVELGAKLRAAGHPGGAVVALP